MRGKCSAISHTESANLPNAPIGEVSDAYFLNNDFSDVLVKGVVGTPQTEIVA